jgi:hypothetical protein
MSDTDWGHLFDRLNDMRLLVPSEYDWVCFAELLRLLEALGVVEQYTPSQKAQAAVESGRRPRPMKELMQEIIDGMAPGWKMVEDPDDLL